MFKMTAASRLLGGAWPEIIRPVAADRSYAGISSTAAGPGRIPALFKLVVVLAIRIGLVFHPVVIAAAGS